MTTPATPSPGLFSSGARKAQVAALIAFLTPLAAFIGTDDAWTWRAFVAAVLAALVAGLGTYATTNQGTTYVGSDRV
jgi:hypothetical protein